jgi:hypothetical protein
MNNIRSTVQALVGGTSMHEYTHAYKADTQMYSKSHFFILKGVSKQNL